MFRDLIPRLAGKYHVIAPDHLGFDDLDDYLAGLASKGITATEPQEVSQGRQRLATITDPDGNQLSLIEQVLKGQ
jgi:predicted enzyme related to lactoylglutathione lyase